MTEQLSEDPAGAKRRKWTPTPGITCLGCILLILSPVLLAVALESFRKHRDDRIVSARARLPRHVVQFDHLRQIPDGEPYISGELIAIQVLFADAGMTLGFPRFTIASEDNPGDKVYVDLPACGKDLAENCYTIQWVSDREYTNVRVVGDRGRGLASGSKVVVEGALTVYDGKEGTLDAGRHTDLKITRITPAPENPGSN